MVGEAFFLTGGALRGKARPKIYGAGRGGEGPGWGTCCAYRMIESTATAKEILIFIELSEASQIYSTFIILILMIISITIIIIIITRAEPA